MSDLFADKGTFEVNFVMGKSKDGGSVYAEVDEKMLREVNEDLDEASIEQHWVRFRRPTFADNHIIELGTTSFKDGKLVQNGVKLDWNRLTCLLHSWSLPLDANHKGLKQLDDEAFAVIAYLLHFALAAPSSDTP